MLLMKEKCELCGDVLPADQAGAFICSYECTFCQRCAVSKLEGICPNCGGGLHPRPTRPEKKVPTSPASDAGLMNTGFAKTPTPPYYAVIFTSQRTDGDNGYSKMANAMYELAIQQQGCLGAESARGTDGVGITVSYFATEEDITAWKKNVRHLVAQRSGKESWYKHYEVRVAKVERAYSGPEGR
jgi:heme-degrading monooxygenase HmoA